MQIMNEQLRLDAEQLFVERQVLDERAIGFDMVEIAEMMTDEGVPVPAQCEGPLQLAADRDDRQRTVNRQRDRFGGVAARTPDRHFDAGNDACHRIVAADMDRAIVDQK